ncbi:MAG: thioredoxin [Candidatus Aminicenantia bacterium]
MEPKIKILNDDNFEQEVLNSQLPVLVDFWAVWCGPCKAMEPILEDLVNHLEGKLKIGKLNVDENLKTPAKYGIRGIPTLLLFKDGRVKESITGLLPREKIFQILEKYL